MTIKYKKEGDDCTHCGEGVLEIIRTPFPWVPYLLCSECDSTYPLLEETTCES